MKRALTVFGIAVAALSVAYGCLMLVTLMARERTQSPLSFENVKAIQLDLGAGSIRLTGSDTTTTTGTRTVVKGVARPRITERLGEDGTLHLSTHCPWYASFNCSASYEIAVPKGTVISGSSSGGSIHINRIAGEINVSSSGGGIDGAELSGAVSLNSSGGGIDVRRSTGRLKLNSSGGGIHVDDSSGPVRASSSGGGIRLSASQSHDVNLSSSGGGIRAVFTEPPTKVRISSSGGGVRLVLPRGEVAYAVDASSSGGGSSVKVKTDPDSSNTIWLRSSGGSVSATYAEATNS